MTTTSHAQIMVDIEEEVLVMSTVTIEPEMILEREKEGLATEEASTWPEKTIHIEVEVPPTCKVATSLEVLGIEGGAQLIHLAPAAQTMVVLKRASGNHQETTLVQGFQISSQGPPRQDDMAIAIDMAHLTIDTSIISMMEMRATGEVLRGMIMGDGSSRRYRCQVVSTIIILLQSVGKRELLENVPLVV